MNFEEAWPIIDGIPGWLTQEEAEQLFNAARDMAGKGHIVEIGSYLGRSSCALCLGSKSAAAPNQASLVFAVDPFTAWIAEQPHDKSIGGPNWTYPDFIENMKRARIMDVIRPMINTSLQAVINWDSKISLLFIDGNHDYEFVSKDFVMWSPYVIPGGIIALHDTETWAGPIRMMSEIRAKYNILGSLTKIGELSLFRKTW